MAAYGYSTAGDIVNRAAIECGLTAHNIPDPFGSSDPAIRQMCGLLTSCGQELAQIYQWQQLIGYHEILTGPSPDSSGEYPLPDDFDSMIDQTGWTPANAGVGLPLAGPMSVQTWAAIVASGLAATTVYVSFQIADGVLKVLPAPAPPNITISFYYQSRSWVDASGTGKDAVTASTDLVKFDPLLIVKMLALRFKQAKSLPAMEYMQQFQAAFVTATAKNAPMPVLRMNGRWGFPYLNAWVNVPQSGFGS